VLPIVDFKITHHSGSAAPDDALDLLWLQLESRRGRVRFVKRGSEIRAMLRDDTPVSMESDEREEIGRRVVLDILREICDRAPKLELDWFAVSPLR
jgi:hypothetical protein